MKNQTNQQFLFLAGYFFEVERFRVQCYALNGHSRIFWNYS